MALKSGEGDLRIAGDAGCHVALPGAGPNIADEHVGKGQFILAGNGQGDGFRRALERGEIDAPFAIRAGGGLGGGAPRCDGDFLSRSSHAPDGKCAPLLEHHVIAENRRHGDIGMEER
jgi:hypothetical protein